MTDPNKVQGQRSPRWAVWKRMMIPCKGGLKYLDRLRLVQTPFFGVMLHDIHEDDGDRDPHNHPYSFVSFVLRGRYVERVYADPVLFRGAYVLRTHRRFSLHRMDRESAHLVVEASSCLKTLVFHGPRHPTWGFFRDIGSGVGEFVEWEMYEREIGSL